MAMAPASGKTVHESWRSSREIIDLPNLVEIQTASYDWFIEKGLRELLEDFSPIEDYTGNMSLEFLDCRLDEPKRSIAECRERDAKRARNPLSVIRSAVLHTGVARHVIIRYKYQRRQRAGLALGQILVDWLKRDAEAALALPFARAAAIVPVPLHWRRHWWRGFNQADLLASCLASQCDIDAEDLLRRVRYTRSQVGLPPERRAANVEGAFVADAERVRPGAAYLLVDDVYTTGATLRACAKALLNAGASEVAAVTVARAVPSWLGNPGGMSSGARRQSPLTR